jgi:hypothetical protein
MGRTDSVHGSFGETHDVAEVGLRWILERALAVWRLSVKCSL